MADYTVKFNEGWFRRSKPAAPQALDPNVDMQFKAVWERINKMEQTLTQVKHATEQHEQSIPGSRDFSTTDDDVIRLEEKVDDIMHRYNELNKELNTDVRNARIKQDNLEAQWSKLANQVTRFINFANALNPKLAKEKGLEQDWRH